MTARTTPLPLPLRLGLRPAAWRRLQWGLALGALALLAGQLFEPIGRQIVPLQDIIVRGGDSQSRAFAERALAEARGRNLINLNLAEWKQRLENLPNVHKVHIQRRLPYTLLVELRSAAVQARWQDGTLINAEGARIAGSVDEALPVFRGDEKRIREMSAFFREANALLPGGIAQVEVAAGGGWKVFLTDGTLVHLGRRPLPRFARYARHAPALARHLPPLRVVDMRYARGFAVQVYGEEESPQEQQQEQAQ